MVSRYKVTVGKKEVILSRYIVETRNRQGDMKTLFVNIDEAELFERFTIEDNKGVRMDDDDLRAFYGPEDAEKLLNNIKLLCI